MIVNTPYKSDNDEYDDDDDEDDNKQTRQYNPW